MEKKFTTEAIFEGNERYTKCIARQNKIYQRENDLRSPFSRDYTRLIFSQGYRRLKHKTQVFFAPANDHVCTRSEHVNLVDSISSTLAIELGLNTELTKAIAHGHDIGHAPFGHGGEHILKELCKKYNLPLFFHEKNSLYFIDNIETLQDDNHHRHNLNLTYAIRDGIISHCGEVNQKNIMRRDEYIDLQDYQHPGQFAPYTWEGCVVKMSDKIAYLARDIEDALRLEIIDENKVLELRQQLNKIVKKPFNAINNGTIVNYFITKICLHSNLQVGISLDDESFEVMKKLMKFNYENIYLIDRVKVHNNYVALILQSLFDVLYKLYDGNLEANLQTSLKDYPQLTTSYKHWLTKYQINNASTIYQNKKIYDLNEQNDQIKSIIDFLSGMSDAYIITLFNEQLSFR